MAEQTMTTTQTDGETGGSRSAKLALLGITLTIFLILGGLSIARYLGFNAKYYDLGAMSQAIWSATQGEPLLFTGRGIVLSRLSRSVELVYFLLAPIYALFPTPITLLVIQAGAYALGALPLFRLARRRLRHDWLAVAVAAIYLLYPTGQTAVFADFHADPLAVPLLLFAIEAADRRAWRRYAVWVLLALTCKFYVAIPIAALGVVLWVHGERRAGAATVIIAALWGAVMFFGLRSAFMPPPAEAAQGLNIQTTPLAYLTNRFQLRFVMDTAVIRLVHGVIVLMPALILLGRRAPLWLLPAAVVVGPVLISNGFGPSFSYRTHHYALAVPFLVVAVLMGAAKQAGSASPPAGKRPAWHGRIMLTLFTTLVFNMAFVDSPLSPTFYLERPSLEQGLSSTRFGVTPRDAFKRDWLAAHAPSRSAVDRRSALRRTPDQSRNALLDQLHLWSAVGRAAAGSGHGD
jgi:uncharacterized membrane protein